MVMVSGATSATSVCSRLVPFHISMADALCAGSSQVGPCARRAGRGV